MTDKPDSEQAAEPPTPYEEGWMEGWLAGLNTARAMVISAPTLSHGQRIANLSGGFPRVRDDAVDPDGDPAYVHNVYALRDAVLHWIDKAIAGNAPQETPHE